MKYQSLNATSAILALWYVTNTSLSAFYKLTEQFGDAKQALMAELTKWQELGVHNAHIKRWQDADDVMAMVDGLYDESERGTYGMLFMDDERYPDMLRQIYDPPPVLFYRGEVARLSDRQVAIVGSRHPTEFAYQTTLNMAEYLTHQGLTVTSGLASGIDKAAHLGALLNGRGQTVGVMGTGINVCYPKNQNALYAQIINDGGCLISDELSESMTGYNALPKTFSRGVLALDDAHQKPPVPTPVVIPSHLQGVFDKLPDKPTDLDTLVMMTASDVGVLLGSLLGLEMLGVVKVVGGRYERI